jgi:hypothetical protein
MAGTQRWLGRRGSAPPQSPSQPFPEALIYIQLNDTTNASKHIAGKSEGCRPLISPHFNITVELSLKAIVPGYSWTVIPITWRNRTSGTSKFQLKEMGSRYLFICLEKYFSRGDYAKHAAPPYREETRPPKILVRLVIIYSLGEMPESARTK